MLKEVLQEDKKNEGRFNVVQGGEGWRTPEVTWMEMEEVEEEVFFVNTLQAGEPDSDAELEAEIARTERAIDDCFRRRSRRAGIAVGVPEGRPMKEEEGDCLSERLGNGLGVRAKRRREIEEMEEGAIETEIKKTEETLGKRDRVAGQRGPEEQIGKPASHHGHPVPSGRTGECLHCL